MINVVRLASIIVIVAREKPLRIAALMRAPSASSSRIRSKIRTLASTAIPTVNTRPAIPDNVNEAPIITITERIRIRFRISAKAATIPGTPKYQPIIKTSTTANEMEIASCPLAIVAVPKDAPILFSLSGSGLSVLGKAPARRTPTMESTSA